MSPVPPPPASASIRLAALFAALVMVLLFHLVSTEYSVYSPVVSAAFLAILGGSFYLPALLAARRNPGPGEGPWFVITLATLAGVGALTPGWVHAALLLLLGAVTGLGLGRDLRSLRAGGADAALTSAFCALAVLLIYGLLLSNNHAQILYAEAFATEIFAGDTFYHSALAESLVSRGDASGSIHGSVTIKYHYLSHLVYGGLSHLAGTRAFYWYAAYAPLLLIGLYVYHGFAFLRRLATYLGQRVPGPAVLCAGLLIAFLLPFPVARYGQPLLGESAGLSYVFLLIHATWLLRVAPRAADGRRFLPVLVGSFVFLTLIAVTKISTGFVWAAGLGLLALTRLPLRRFLATLPFFAALALVVLLVIFPEHRMGIDSSVAERVRNLFVSTGGAFYLLLPAAAALLLIGRRGGWWGPARLFSARGPREIVGKTLLGVWVAGLLGALATSNVAADVLYFTLIPYVLGLWLLGLWGYNRLAARFGAWERSRWLALLLLPLLLASPFYFYGWGNLVWLAGKSDWTEVEQRRLELLGQFRRIEASRPGRAGLYAPPPAAHFYEYGAGNYPDPALLAVGTTGLPVVSGLLPWQFEQYGRHYGIYYYQRRGVPAVDNEADARALLPTFGLDSLIIVR